MENLLNHPWFHVGCDMYERIKLRFDEEDIEISFPYRNLVLKDGNICS